MKATEYRFGSFRLLPAMRELWSADRLVHVPRRGLDCLAYLIEHRDRAVGRDELVAALWGRVDVTDKQVNQAVLRARTAIGDNGQVQQAIRTLPGFGYRWVMAVETVPVPVREDVKAGEMLVPIGTDSSAPSASSPRKRHAFWALSIVALALGLVAAAYLSKVTQAPPPSVATNDDIAVVVLPLDVTAPREAGWVRLGAMDLIADRLRVAGLPVPPSDSVVSALHAIGEPLDPARMAKLQHTLGAAMIVRGSAVKSADGWKVELGTTAANGTHLRETTENADITEAARQAAGMLLAALGDPQPTNSSESEGVQELLQQAQAALLAGELEMARTILTNVPAPADPQVRAKLTQVDFREGRLDAAVKALTELLDDPAVIAQPLLHAQVLTTRGFIDIRREDCASAETYFDAAVSALPQQRTSREWVIALAARGHARSCLHQFDDAATDLGTARTRMEAAGDRMGIARVNNYFGLLEVERNRMEDALPYYSAAADTAESFGAVEVQRANLSALLIVQSRLLRWSDALVTSDRLWALRDRLRDPALLFATAGLRADVLTTLGRYREADAILTEAEKKWPDTKGEPARFLYDARAELAWQQGHAEAALASAADALAIWPSAPHADEDDYARLALLRQRASIALGKAIPAQLPRTDAGAKPATEGDVPSAILIAQGEWKAQLGRDADAERLLRAALADAEAKGIPDDIARAARAYATWLLARGRSEDAGAPSGRIAAWAERDFDCALLQVRVFHATGQVDAWAKALRTAQGLAGERELPTALLKPPTPS